MKRQPVTSSNIVSVGYDAITQELEVEFKGGGVYVYSGVPLDVHREMMAAPSIGQFLHARIKPCYPCRKVPAAA